MPARKPAIAKPAKPEAAERPARAPGSKPVKSKSAKPKSVKPNPARPDSFVYVLGTVGKDGRRLTYVGWTNDVSRRLARHNDGTGARTTRGRVWVLLHAEKCASRRHAMSREWHLKRDRAFRKELALSLKT